MRIVAGLWRWRGNSLCRRTDRGEAWLALCAVLLIAVGVPLIALSVRDAAYAELMTAVHAQQRHRHLVWATVQQVLPDPSDSDLPRSGDVSPHRVVATWQSPDGAPRTGAVGTGHRMPLGERFRIWTDGHGKPTVPPMTAQGASSHAVVAGLVAGVAAGFTLEAGRRLAVRELMRRRYARWDEEWARIGPDWGRAGTTN